MGHRIALYLDIDNVVQASHLKYGYEMTRVIAERIPTELVHPAMRPQRLTSGIGEHRRLARPKPFVSFNTNVRISPRMLEDIAALDVDIAMLTSWLEHDSVDRFWEAMPVRLAYRKLTFPGRDFRDPLGAIPLRWKVEQLHADQAREQKPFIWADDDEVPSFRSEIAETYPDTPHLLIAPTESIGITRHHMELMREFVQEHGQ